MKRWKLWAGIAVLLAIADAYAFLNFLAAVDLGYDATPRGKRIIEFWGYAWLGGLAGLLIAIAASLLSWRASKRLTT